MTFELRILALSVVLGLVQIVLASHAASLQRGYLLDRRFTRRGRAPVDWNSGPVGAGAAQFCRHVSAVRCNRPYCACNEHPQLDDRMGRPTLLWPSCSPTSPCMRRVCFSALTRVERGDARDRDGTQVTCLNHASPVVHAARSGLLAVLFAYDHLFPLGHCTSAQPILVRNLPFSEKNRGSPQRLVPGEKQTYWQNRRQSSDFTHIR